MKTVSLGSEPMRMTVSVPEHATILDPVVKAVPALPDPAQAVKDALANPIGMKRLSELVNSGSRVAIAFDDHVGTSYIKIMLPSVLDELRKAGVSDKHIKLICAVGLHYKKNADEMFQIAGPIAEKFWLYTHDAEDKENLVYLGETPTGGPIELNKDVKDSDLWMYVGSLRASVFGGYNAGHKGLVIGMGSPRNNYGQHKTMLHPDSANYDAETNYFRKHVDDTGKIIEDRLGKEVMYVNAVVSTENNIIGVVAGHAPEMYEKLWAMADRQYKVRIDTKPADVLVVGLPPAGRYGSMGPISVLWNLSCVQRAWSGKPFLKGGSVIIATASVSPTDENRFPSYNEALRLFKTVHLPEELAIYEDYLLFRPEYIYAYRYKRGFHGIHPLLVYQPTQYTLENTSERLIVGSGDPGAIRDIQCTPVRTFDEAWRMTEKIMGKDPATIVLPNYFSAGGGIIIPR